MPELILAPDPLHRAESRTCETKPRSSKTCCWLFFHRDLAANVPEAWEVRRFQTVAQRKGIDLKVLKPQLFDLIVDGNASWSAVYQGKKLSKPDFIISRTGSETAYFTLAVMRHFERQGVPVINGSEAVEAVADKLHTLQVLSQAGLPIPKTILGKFPVDVDVVERQLGFPVVVKTLRGTRGNGVMLCQDRAQFDDVMNLLEGAGQGADVIFQQYVRASHGRDVRVLVIDGEVVAAMERRATDGGFKSNISLGGAAARFEPPAEMADLAIKVARELKLDVAGVDILFDDGGYRICEANSSPGFQGLEPACGVNVPELVFDAVLKRQALPAARPTSWLRKLAASIRGR
jgi:gamma-F420-2:alpha-L-glutamate ligase